MKRLILVVWACLGLASTASANATASDFSGSYAGTGTIDHGDGQHYDCDSAKLSLKLATGSLEHSGLSLACGSLEIQGGTTLFERVGNELRIGSNPIGSIDPSGRGFEIRYCETEQQSCIQMSASMDASGALTYAETVTVGGEVALVARAKLSRLGLRQ